MSIFFFGLGCVLASFLNLCVYRIEKKDSLKNIFVGRSFCETCKKTLLWYELIPLFSFLFLKGRCSKCFSKIPPFIFFSELLLGTSFLVFSILSVPYPFYFFLLVLYFFSAYDFNYKCIPKVIADVLFAMSVIYWFFSLFFYYDISRIYSVCFFLFLFLILKLASRKKTLFGFGDVIVIAMLSLWFELEFFLLNLFFIFSVGGFFSILLVLKDKSYLKKYIPFLPFVFFGFLISTILYFLDINVFDYIYPM